MTGKEPSIRPSDNIAQAALGYRQIRVWNHSQQAEVAGRVDVAATPWSRFRGLLGRAGLEPGQGMLITPCRAVHSCGMRFAIDVVFLGLDGTVVGCHADLRPWRFSGYYRDAELVLELASGAAAGRVNPGDRLAIGPVDAIVEP